MTRRVADSRAVVGRKRHNARVKELVAVTSVSQILNGNLIDRVAMVPMLKRAAILCDQIYVETWGLGVPGGAIEKRAIDAAFGGTVEGIDLQADGRFRKLLLLPQEFGLAGEEMVGATMTGTGPGRYWDAAAQYVDTMPDEDLESMAKPWRGVDYKTRAAMALELQADLERPAILRKWIDEPVGLLAPTHREVLRIAMEKDRSPVDILQELAVQTVFDFGSLSWDQVLKLRKSSRIEDFRFALQKMEALGPGSVQGEWRRQVEELAEISQPNPLKTLLGAFMTYLPLGDADPLGLAQNVTTYFREDEQARRYAWIYFVMNAREGQRREKARQS
jgi:hypothetical protein